MPGIYIVDNMKRERIDEIVENNATPKTITECLECARMCVRRARVWRERDWKRSARYLQHASALADEARRLTEAKSTHDACDAIDRAALSVWRKLGID
jgi:hypothetical protein